MGPLLKVGLSSGEHVSIQEGRNWPVPRRCLPWPSISVDIWLILWLAKQSQAYWGSGHPPPMWILFCWLCVCVSRTWAGSAVEVLGLAPFSSWSDKQALVHVCYIPNRRFGVFLDWGKMIVLKPLDSGFLREVYVYNTHSERGGNRSREVGWHLVNP